MNHAQINYSVILDHPTTNIETKFDITNADYEYCFLEQENNPGTLDRLRFCWNFQNFVEYCIGQIDGATNPINIDNIIVVNNLDFMMYSS